MMVPYNSLRRHACAVAMLGTIVSCYGDEPPKSICSQATSEDDLFNQTVAPIVDKDCAPCHTNNQSPMRLYVGNNEHNRTELAKRGFIAYKGIMLPLAKMIGDAEHGGKVRYGENSEEYAAMETWLAAAVSEKDMFADCGDAGASKELWSRLILLDESATVFRAYREIAGIRAPKAIMDALASGGMTAEEAILQMLTEPSIEEFVKELEDAHSLHTRKYWFNGVDVLSAEHYPNKNVWESQGFSEAQKEEWKACAETAVGQEVVNTIWEHVRLDLPYTDLACASVAMNPCSARVYYGHVNESNSVTPTLNHVLDEFEDPYDFDEYIFLNPPDVPEGGGPLASNMFNTRWPTTPTNRSRNRAKYWWERTLNTAILARGNRPVDPNAVGAFNAVMNQDACTVCHSDNDPVAQLFELDWENGGAAQIPDDAWHADMFPPGIGQDCELPYEERSRALAWAGDLVCEDPNLRAQFRTGAVARYYTGITGVRIYARPSIEDTALHPEARTNGVKRQEAFLAKLASIMEKNDDNIKHVVVHILMSEWYRTIGVTGSLSEEEAAELSVIGNRCVKNPRALDRFIRSIGLSWTDGNGESRLTNAEQYLFYAGGADSDQRLTPLCDTNGFRALVEDRMGHELACKIVANDFALPPEERMWFPFVEMHYLPTLGFLDLMRDNIRHIHAMIHGRTLPESELAMLVELMIESQAACMEASYSGTWSSEIPKPCQATHNMATGEPLESPIKTDPLCTNVMWRAAVDVMLTDPKVTHGISL